jgi:hypothetical protein
MGGYFIMTMPTPKLKPKLKGHENAHFFSYDAWKTMLAKVGFTHISSPLTLHMEQVKDLRPKFLNILLKFFFWRSIRNI